MKLTTVGIPGLCLALVTAALTGCGGTSNGGGKAKVVDGGTFTLGLSSDPGGLDPQLGAGTSLFTVTRFAYDPLVSVEGKTGEIRSALAKNWQVRGNSVTLTLADGITCSDGTRLTASDVADNLNFVVGPMGTGCRRRACTRPSPRLSRESSGTTTAPAGSPATPRSGRP